MGPLSWLLVGLGGATLGIMKWRDLANDTSGNTNKKGSCMKCKGLEAYLNGEDISEDITDYKYTLKDIYTYDKGEYKEKEYEREDFDFVCSYGYGDINEFFDTVSSSKCVCKKHYHENRFESRY